MEKTTTIVKPNYIAHVTLEYPPGKTEQDVADDWTRARIEVFMKRERELLKAE